MGNVTELKKQTLVPKLFCSRRRQEKMTTMKVETDSCNFEIGLQIR